MKDTILEKNDKLNSIFLTMEKIDNIPVIVSYNEKVIDNFEFALKIDPFLFIQLLAYANLEGYGFFNKISMIEQISSVIDTEILISILKSNACFDEKHDIDKELVYFLLIYPTYLVISDILSEPNWLTEREQNILTLTPAGFMLRKLFFKKQYSEIKEFSFKKRISIKDGESLLKYPSSTLLLNIHFLNKKIPITISDFIKDIPLSLPQGKMSFILELVDRFLFTRFYQFPKIEESLIDFINKKLKSDLSLSEFYQILLTKSCTLFNNLLPENIKDQVFYFIDQNYQREQEREKSSNKIAITNSNDRIYELEEV